MNRVPARLSARLLLITAMALALCTGLAGTSQAAQAEIGPDSPPIAVIPPDSSATGPLVGVKADDGATVISQKQVDDRTIDLGIDSPAVGVRLPVRVIVPDGWSPTSSRRWPLVMLLHGGHDDYTSWSTQTVAESLSSSWPVIIVMPEGGQTAAYTDYLQKGTPALQWETFHTKELLQIMQRGLRASTTRAIAGASAGGYGAMDYAARHPGMFKFAGSYSGALAIQMPALQAGILWNDLVNGSEYARYGKPDNPQWERHDPFVLSDNLTGTSLYVASGYSTPDDVPNLDMFQMLENGPWMIAHDFAGLLDNSGIPVTTSFTLLGAHTWPYWSDDLVKSWTQMMAALNVSPT